MDVPAHSESNHVIHRPKTLVCHICGREFGTKSLAIHVKACAKKWEDAEALKPKKQRRPVPKAPSDAPGGMSRAELDERNAAAMTAFEQQAMVQCPNCGRTFLEDRLSVHLRSCTADNPHRAVNKPKEVTSAPTAAPKIRVPVSEPAGNSAIPEYAEVRMIPCSSCGRNFTEDRLAKHEAVCRKAGKKPRGVFQSAAKRAVDPIMIQSRGREAQSSKDTGKWKRQHQDFMQAMKYSKQVKKAQQEGRDIRSIPAPASTSDYSDYVQCPYCGRKYAQQTAERHIPRCKDIVNKPKPPPSQRLAPASTATFSSRPLASSPSAGSRSSTNLSGSPRPGTKASTHLSSSPSATTNLSGSPRPATRSPVANSSPRPVTKSPGPAGPVSGAGRPGTQMAKSSTEATFRRVLKPCPGCRAMVAEAQMQEHLQSCPSASVKSTTLQVPGTAAPRRSAEQASTIKAFCAMCGERFVADAKFCTGCGTRR